MDNPSLGNSRHPVTDGCTVVYASTEADTDTDTDVEADRPPSGTRTEAVYQIAYPPASTRIAPAEVVAILARHYGIVTVHRCELERASQNEVYRVTLDDGATRFARLERLHKWQTKNVPYEFALLTALRNAGQPVCVAVQTRSGDWTVAVSVPERLKRFSLFEEVKGTCPANDDASLFASGVALGKLHNAIRNSVFPDMPATVTLETLLEQIFDVILSSHLIDVVDLQAFIALKGRLAHALQRSAADRAVWRLGHYHSDPYNNRLARRAENGETTIAFIDFDDARPGYLAMDLSDFLEKTMVTFDATQAIDATTSARWAAFIRGYARSADVDDREIAHLPLLIALRSQCWTAMFLKNDGLIGRFDQRHALQDGYRKACYVLDLVCTRTAIRHVRGSDVSDLGDVDPAR